MGAIKLEKFLGKAPRIAPELLPQVASQICSNIKLYNGNLLPFREPKIVANTALTGGIRTLYGLRDNDDELVLISWAGPVDVAVASSSEDSNQRFYYTGDGVPKVSDYDLATAGGVPPYPTLFYELGLPLPDTQATATEQTFSNKNTASFARDAANVATIVTGTAHELRTGNVISIRDFSGDPASSFNATNVTATVIDDTTFTYSSPGDFVATTADTNGVVELAGDTDPRSYVYTWFTPWDEESIASEPSDDIFLKEGQTVIVSSLPNGPPVGDNFIRGIRLYRIVPSSNQSEYFRLKTLWFPTLVAETSRASEVSTVKLAFPHNLIEEDRFKISGCVDSTFDITDGEVIDVIDLYTFTYAQAGQPDAAVSADNTGVMFHDVSEDPDDPARYWGDVDYDFTDDFLVDNLFDSLDTDDYDPPDPDMVGIRVAQNNFLVGFFGNQLCFSEIALPHAWPIRYRRTIEYDIVAVEPVAGFILVMTDRFPYQVSGGNPNTVTVSRLDTPYPCLAKQSVVNMGYGVVYATHGGLAYYSPAVGVKLLTEFVHYWETWEETLDPTTIVAEFYNDKYYASHSNGAFMFEKDDKVGGYLVDITTQFSAAYVDRKRNAFLFVDAQDVVGDVYEYDPPNGDFQVFDWKSKVFVVKNYINLGAARIIGNFDVAADLIAEIEQTNQGIVADNEALFLNIEQLNTINGGTDYIDPQTTLLTRNDGTLNGTGLMFNSSFPSAELEPLPEEFSVTFRLFANRELVFETEITDESIFRLPTGYRTDTFEVEVEGRAIVRAIHLAETPYGLREV